MLDAERESMGLPHRVFHTPADRESVEPMAQAAISTILAALKDPTERMLASANEEEWDADYDITFSDCWRVMLNASSLGEQSE